MAVPDHLTSVRGEVLEMRSKCRPNLDENGADQELIQQEHSEPDLATAAVQVELGHLGNGQEAR